jgi:hypothetical protein
MVYITTQNAIICRRCGMFRSAVLAGADTGLTPQKLAEFHAREPAPDPAGTTAETTTTTKLTPQQLEARQAVINGDVPGMTLEDWERRLGVYGTDYAKQYGLDTPTETDVMVVDGVPCVLVDGEWVPTDQTENETENEEEPGL